MLSPLPAAAAGHPGATAPTAGGRCPWATATAARREDPRALALSVLGRMTTLEKLRFVDLRNGQGYENHNAGVARLCIPMLTLEDGPNGIAYNNSGVTQLPASLGVAASFDRALAYRYGQVIGREARLQGVDVVQGPNLNLDRVPTSGRAFEAYGEDPTLTAAMGVADIEGIQSEGVMAEAKHLTGYTQETDRLHLDQTISERALEELYLAPFRAAVTEAHVASVMCAYGQINGVYACQDPALFATLKRSWGFAGFVRSDLGAVDDPVAAFNAGLDALKPAALTTLSRAITAGTLPMSRLDDAVTRILTAMFADGLVTHPLRGRPDTPVASAADATLALQAAERSIVLLKDAGGVLPLDPARLRSVAVIGPDAAGAAATAGFGSAHVIAPSVVTPLVALRRWLGPAVRVGYAAGGPSLASFRGRLSLRAGAAARPAGRERGLARAPLAAAASAGVSPRSPGDDSAQLDATAAAPGSGRGWRAARRTLSPTSSGLYSLSVSDSGDSFVYAGRSLVLADRGVHGRSSWSRTLPLRARRPVTLELRWLARPGIADPQLALSAVSPDIARAVALARRSTVALVFADDSSSEGSDRPDLSLPGDEDALISAVAAVNPKTIVVLNTGGPVLMPWLGHVAGLIEAWYPGEADGSAISAVLSGAVDPAGHLPVTFPAGQQEGGTLAARSWPGVAGRVAFADDLAIGYRADEGKRRPLFAFGEGLSYTRFALSGARLSTLPSGVAATVRVRNVGQRPGTAVVQGYLGFPAAAGEPPRQLAAFASATLRPGGATTVTLDLPERAFLAYLGGRFMSVAGSYTLFLGWSSRSLPLRLTLPAPGGVPSSSPPATSDGRGPQAEA